MVGNRDLLAAHHIDPPSRDFENQHKAGGQELLYLAVGGELVALFQLQYRIDARRIRQLQNMELSGISLIVRTRNPHITREFLCGRMKLDENSVKVLSEDLGDVYDHAVEGMSEQGEALFATRGRVVSLMRLLPGCVRLRAHITLLVAMQNVSVILGFVLVALLACYSGMGQLTTLSLLLYEDFGLWRHCWCPGSTNHKQKERSEKKFRPSFFVCFYKLAVLFTERVKKLWKISKLYAILIMRTCITCGIKER